MGRSCSASAISESTWASPRDYGDPPEHAEIQYWKFDWRWMHSEPSSGRYTRSPTLWSFCNIHEIYIKLSLKFI